MSDIFPDIPITIGTPKFTSCAANGPTPCGPIMAVPDWQALKRTMGGVCPSGCSLGAICAA
jgi:hypothetical protein